MSKSSCSCTSSDSEDSENISADLSAEEAKTDSKMRNQTITSSSSSDHSNQDCVSNYMAAQVIRDRIRRSTLNISDKNSLKNLAKNLGSMAVGYNNPFK